MSVTVLFFGSLTDEYGRQPLARKIAGNSRVGTLWSEITGMTISEADGRGIRPARNRSYCDWLDEVEVGDEIAFLAPVCGG